MAPKRVAKSPARPSPAGKSPAKSTPPAKVKPPPKPPPSKFRKRAGYAALFLAILLGLMLRIPTYGWIFWMATGNPVPPYLVYDAWKGDEDRSWHRDGAVVVSAGGM